METKFFTASVFGGHVGRIRGLASVQLSEVVGAGKCLERFFGIRKETPAILNQFVSFDTTQLEEERQFRELFKQLALLTNITSHLNLKRQGRNR